MRAYTYLVVNIVNGRWYYGVRYAKNCTLNDLLKTYFTSSKEVQREIKKYGIENFIWEIRKTFSDVDEAKSWECRVLTRMNVCERKDSYNKHSVPGLPVMSGDNNPSRRPEIREKLRSTALLREATYSEKEKTNNKNKIQRTKMIRNISKFVKTISTECQPTLSEFHKCQRYGAFVLEYKPQCKNIQKLLERVASNYTRVYPSGRVSSPRGKLPNLSKSLMGLQWYTAPDGVTLKRFRNESDVPPGWTKGIKSTDRNEKVRQASTGKRHTKTSIEKMKDICKKKKYYTSPDFQTLKAFTDGTVPDGWIPGNKLQTRNEKISKYLKEERHGS